jgi:ABC-type transporter Mla subunit MlaD
MNEKVLEVQKEKLTTIFTNFAQISKDALGSSTALRDVAASLTEQNKGFIEANSNMLELTNALKMSVSELKEYQQAVAASQLEYSRQLSEHKNHMDVTTAAFDERLTNYIERVGKANTTLDETVRMLDRSIQEVATGNAQLLDTLNQNEKQLELTGDQIDKFLVSASVLTEKVKQNSDDITAYIESAKEASINVAESIHTELIEDFRTSSEQLRLLNDELKQVNDSLSQTYRDLSDGLGDTFRNFDENTANIADQFSDMLENIRITADYIPRRLNDALEVYFGVNNDNDTSENMVSEYDPESVISEDSYDSEKESYSIDGDDTELNKSEE